MDDDDFISKENQKPAIEITIQLVSNITVF